MFDLSQAQGLCQLVNAAIFNIDDARLIALKAYGVELPKFIFRETTHKETNGNAFDALRADLPTPHEPLSEVPAIAQPPAFARDAE